MSGGDNTSQVSEYEGRPYHEKKFHKTHFGVLRTLKGTHPKDDPDWEYAGAGRWKLKQKRKSRRVKRREELNDV